MKNKSVLQRILTGLFVPSSRIAVGVRGVIGFWRRQFPIVESAVLLQRSLVLEKNSFPAEN